MFPFLVALTLSIVLLPTRPALSLEQTYPRGPRSFLPIASVVAAPGPPGVQAPVKKDSLRLGLETASRGAAVMDWRTGRLLFEKNAHQAMPVASITKLMTALAVLGEGVDWDRPVEILPEDVRTGGIPYVIPGERITVRDLFHVSLIASGNTAAVSLMRSTGLTAEEFVDRMNRTAAGIGMADSRFTDPTGLDPGNVSTAHDVALLIREGLGRDEIGDVLRKKEYEFTALTGLTRKVQSTDELLGSHLARPPFGFLGGKTGFTTEADYCFGAAAQNGNGDKVIAVSLGAPTRQARFDEVKNMIFWTFDAYQWPFAPVE